jgi:hypothetical protein
MIPPNQILKTRMTSEVVSYVALHDTYFKKADVYSRLNKIFNPEDLIGRIMLWVDMVVSPLMTIVTAIWNMEMPGVFSIYSFYKTFNIWAEWFEYTVLQHEIHEWKRLVKSIGGPFISTNEPLYHSYVYADGMERLRLILTEKLAKRT